MPTGDTGDTDVVPPPGVIDATPGTTAYTLETDDGDRTFEVHVPASYDPAGAHGLVFFFHGGNGSSAIDWTQFIDVTEESGIIEQGNARSMIVVTPDALYGNWADGRGTTDAELAGVDDVAFVAELIEILAADLAIDRDRIFGTGFSNGGLFTNTLACRLPGTFAATSGVAALIPNTLVGCDTVPTPRVQIQGEDDPFQDWEGVGEVASSYATAAHWASVNGCSDTAGLDALATHVAGEAPDVASFQARGCEGGADVDFYVVRGLGHAWPPDNEAWSLPGIRLAVGPNTDAIDATATFLDFFEAHPR